MAIYHLRATMISRSAGRSSTAAAAYRAAARIEDHRTGLSFDYRARSGVDHTEILAPAHAPDWVSDRSALWNAVEAAETRKNSQVAREIRVALPAELDLPQRVELVRDFCRGQFVERGMVADIALHAPGRDGDDRNHHAHILLTTREIGPEGFTAKNRDWNAVELLEHWREAWADHANRALERAGHEERVDHRTLEAQRSEVLEQAADAREQGDEAEELAQTVRAVALDRRPLPQLSAGAWQLKERGIEVAAVRVWHEVRAQAAEVARIAHDLAVHVRDWLARGMERAVERIAPRGPGLASASAGLGGPLRQPGPEAVREVSRDDPSTEGQDLASRLRAAWEARQNQHDRSAPEVAPQPDASPSLADRLREAAKGVDPGAYADRAAQYQKDRLEEDRQRALDTERSKDQQRQQTRERTRDRDDGHEL